LDVAFREDLTGTIHVGTERKTVKNLAIKLGKTDVGELMRDDVSFKVPFDTSLNLDRLKTIKNKDSDS